MIYILASKSLTILSLLSTALLVVDIGDDNDDDVSTLSSSESVGSDPVAVWGIYCYIFNNISNVASTCVFYKTIFLSTKIKK